MNFWIADKRCSKIAFVIEDEVASFSRNALW